MEKFICEASVRIRDGESPGVPVAVSGVIVECAGATWDVPLEEMPSVLDTSVAPSVGTWVKTLIFSVAEVMCVEVLVFISLGVIEGADCVSNGVDSEEAVIEVETEASLSMEVGTIGEVTLDSSVSAGTEECVSCSELVLALVTAVCLER